MQENDFASSRCYSRNHEKNFNPLYLYYTMAQLMKEPDIAESIKNAWISREDIRSVERDQLWRKLYMDLTDKE